MSTPFLFSSDSASERASDASRAVAAPLRVLVVEDEDPVRGSLVQFLEDRGYTVAEAANGSAGLKSLEERPADVVISDIRMPVLDGLGMLKVIKERHPRVEVVLVTAFGDMDTAIEAARHDAYDFIKKPYSLNEIHLVLRRIAAKRALQEELNVRKKQMERAQWLHSLGALAAGIMHEINNPNTFIAGNAQFLKGILLPILSKTNAFEVLEKEAGVSYADVVKSLDGIAKGSERIGEIVRRATLFNIKRAERPRVFDVLVLIPEIQGRIQHLLHPGVRFIRDLPTKPVLMMGNEETVMQVIGNLVSNALEAIQGRMDGVVTLRLASDEQVLIKVEDNGPGIPEDKIEHMFNPFATTKKDRPGRGLGLFIVHQLVTDMNGQLGYERRDGVSVFTLRLPKARPGVVTGAASSNAPGPNPAGPNAALAREVVAKAPASSSGPGLNPARSSAEPPAAGRGV